MASGHQSRLAAGALIARVLGERRTLDEALASTPSFEALEGPDRGFARAIASAVFRQLGRIEAGLDPLLDRSPGMVDLPVRALLLAGAAQLWDLNTPAHAAVGATVTAAKAGPETGRAAGFLNAVLRRAAGERSAFDAAPARATWPAWLQADLTASLGTDAADALAAAQLAEPALHLTLREAGAAALFPGATPLPGGGVIAGTHAVEDLPGYAEGAWWVQDSAAALPVRLLAPGPGDRIADLCAAPGGKTLQLAAAGADVVALDRSRPRLARLHENLARTGLAGRVDVIAARVEDWQPEAPFRKIVLDAPCSALGTLRRHPEGAWIKAPSDLARFPALQEGLLRAAIGQLAPGGVLVYCVCTPRHAEGEGVVEAVLADAPATRLAVTIAEIPGFETSLTPEGDVLTLPGADFERHHDAFFISRLQRTR